MSKYYSTQRPISIGTYPKPQGNPVIDFHNFDRRQYVQEIGGEAWGWITYVQPLSEQDMKAYELVSEKRMEDEA